MVPGIYWKYSDFIMHMMAAIKQGIRKGHVLTEPTPAAVNALFSGISLTIVGKQTTKAIDAAQAIRSFITCAYQV